MPWSIILLGACFVVFGLLARLMPCNRGQAAFLTRELPDNLIYWLFGTLFYTGLTAAVLAFATKGFAGADAGKILKAVAHGFGPLARLPLWAQVVLVLAVTDFAQYWLHRLFHTRWLWSFHAIHHSAEEVDWSTTFRFHPVNFVLYSTSVSVLTALMGFSPAAFAASGLINFFMGAMVHANVDWRFGPFRHVIASPVFHRWHHSIDPRVRDMNFAPNFPVWDVMFGTFHMPEGERPQGFGAEGTPRHILGQMVYPVRLLIERPARRDAQEAPPARP
jgi:sterol desaturase/sphingolipid hydroxylase (fatty acid hydroxylase superfamily)